MKWICLIVLRDGGAAWSQAASNNGELRMIRRVTLVLTALATTASAQWLNYPAAGIPRLPDGKPNLTASTPRMPDGRPDLSGLWRIVRGDKYTLNVAADLNPEEIQPWARFLARRQMEEQGDAVECLPGGPQVGGIITLFKFVQTPGLMIVLHEAGTGDAFRQIFIDGRELPKDPTPSWYGYSVKCRVGAGPAHALAARESCS
jgi:hypothetical protein